jgi:hypothetical protein
MPTYLVRTIDEHDLVGIFVASSLLELALLIDEGLDPGICEYLRIGAGGIMWTGPAVAIPVPSSGDDAISDDPIPWSEATFTEGWEEPLHGYGPSKGKWKPLEFDIDDLSPDEPDDTPSPPAKRTAAQTETARILPYRKRGT